jgi:hypothetical protein
MKIVGAAEACKSTNSQLLWEQGEKNPIFVWIETGLTQDMTENLIQA